MPTIDLTSLRLTAMRVLAGLITVLAVAVVAGALFVTLPGKWPAAVLAVLLAILPGAMAMQQRTDASARMLTSITVMIMPVLLLFAFEGEPWQVDLHMTFFALLAIVAILCDWKAVCAAAGVVAVHHIGFGLLIPQWIFTGTGSVGRVGFHAVILIVEAVTLMWLGARIVALLAAIERQNEERKSAADALAAERTEQADAVAVVTASLGEGLMALTEGDLTAEIHAEYPEGYGMLRSNFNGALTSLRQLIGSVSESADGIRTGSSQIAQASEDLARRTESSAASLEETSAALCQIESRIKATSASAITTVQRADGAIATVAVGRATVEEAVQAMGRVSDSAKGIDSVIEGLDKIAFQTRVLAMNAAVEAGRAGDAGRGFAVVADLVSALAMRAEEEAKRARDQLSVTQSEIGTAVDAVRKVDGSFVDISAEVAGVHALLGDMASDNAAQSNAISEISAAINTMDQATQQNAAMVEETSAAARNLTTEVISLTNQAAQFRVETKSRGAPVHFRPSAETLAARTGKTQVGR
ncbi:methyl-accepting chemotaxis protein [Sphingomonas sp. HMP6]|uniref:methyl-accepting chemotaxis protein n=1 Tax=Sphingomonas sp. HMP6 TaxID=1517551 RepID=UPI001597C0BA|nr:methyl-accepting chemotaxis protein [Sphingomonas sp. HMP6]BCA58917.1 chemotaxis protein [Sphingomonas sp. HMP6]